MLESLPLLLSLLTAPPAPPAAGAASSSPPAPLVCLARYYAVEPRQNGAAWFALLPGGKEIPYDDGRAKTFEEKLAAPDVEDVFSIPYPTGPIAPVTGVDDDPGRIRIDELFAATYGARRSEVDVITIHFLDQELPVQRRVAPAFLRVAARLSALLAATPALRPYLQKLGGTFVWRPIAGTNRQSAHSYGVSMDINVKRSHYWRWQKPRDPVRWQNDIPEAIVRAFEAEGFIWGGRWYHYDTMHFEYRPELLDRSCYPTGAAAR